MDTVTTAPLAISIALQGGLGIIHKNMSPEAQAEEVRKVKRWQSGIVSDPVTLDADEPVLHAFEMRARTKVSGFPVLSKGKVVGMLTSRDLRTITDTSVKVKDVMTKKPITAGPKISLAKAKEILNTNRIEKLPLVDANGTLKGLVTMTDILKRESNPNASLDKNGQLLVGAAASTSADSLERIKLLVEAGVDLLVIDTAHGHHIGVRNMVKTVRKKYPKLTICAGNGVRTLADSLADSERVGEKLKLLGNERLFKIMKSIFAKPISLAELASEFGISMSNAYKILSKLVEERYIYKNEEDQKYVANKEHFLNVHLSLQLKYLIV